MEKHLHITISQQSISDQQTDPIEAMQQIRMEQDFANELAVLKTIKLEPRKEAVEQLFQMIAQQNVAEHH
ncbi:hypothetical protein F0919_02140 [Taibaiella lutea]|uniref:Uncharacterized protein n=1 Tax=Taibaiella lutea TaxID=2608001 RepID=A0A5M6CQ29_9BACT|nr:hypothetical protein [Taibaiella lutea]KAA5536490.1 hypothetical protein F0919_02140 [Taibaiella lutea]